jgi:hypothetical protein
MSAQPSLCFEQSPALIAFRGAAGDANRLLNTLLVALETLQGGAAPVRPADLVVAWSLPTATNEWADTRDFALRGTMVVLVDALDRYLRILGRIQGFTDPVLDDRLNGRKAQGDDRRPTLPERVASVCAHYAGAAHPSYVIAVSLLVAWRNRFVHLEHRADLSRNERQQLLQHAAFLKKEFAGVVIEDVLARFDARLPPTLLDLSTLLAATHRLVREIDAHLLHLQNGQDYAVALMRYLLDTSPEPASMLETIFFKGGTGAAGRVLALFLENGANHSPNRTASAPSLTRKNLDAVLGLSRNKASELFGITRPTTGPGR